MKAWLFPLLVLLTACNFLGGMSRHLADNGVSAEATIVDVWDTGITVNDDPVVGLSVEVTPKDRPPFRATIKRLLISQIDIPQVQPGNVIGVRFDPNNPSDIAVDGQTGNPYHDHFASDSPDESHLKPAAAEPSLYRGTGSVDDDYVALLENGYALLGVAIVKRGGADPSLAVKQAKEIGASTVVVYGPAFDTAAPLADLPLRRKNSSSTSLLKRLPPIDPAGRLATFWGNHEPWVFGLFCRNLNDAEKRTLGRTSGIVAELIPLGSPAEAAGIAGGDVIVSVDGQTIRTIEDLDSLMDGLAGKQVMVDLLRDGASLTLPVRMNARAGH